MSTSERRWKVSDVMSDDVMTVTPSTPFKVLVEELIFGGVSALPVIGADGRLAGVVSETDLVTKQEYHPGGDSIRWTPALLRLAGNRDATAAAAALAEATKAAGRRADDVMTSPALTITSDASLPRAAVVMHRREVNQLPVVDGEGRLVGIVTRGDLLKVFLRTDRELERDVADVIRQIVSEPRAVTVSVTEGVVSVDGEVASQEEADVMAGMVAGLPGVVGVDCRLHT